MTDRLAPTNIRHRKWELGSFLSKRLISFDWSLFPDGTVGSKDAAQVAALLDECQWFRPSRIDLRGFLGSHTRKHDFDSSSTSSIGSISDQVSSGWTSCSKHSAARFSWVFPIPHHSPLPLQSVREPLGVRWKITPSTSFDYLQRSVVSIVCFCIFLRNTFTFPVSWPCGRWVLQSLVICPRFPFSAPNPNYIGIWLSALPWTGLILIQSQRLFGNIKVLAFENGFLIERTTGTFQVSGCSAGHALCIARQTTNQQLVKDIYKGPHLAKECHGHCNFPTGSSSWLYDHMEAPLRAQHLILIHPRIAATMADDNSSLTSSWLLGSVKLYKPKPTHNVFQVIICENKILCSTSKHLW